MLNFLHGDKYSVALQLAAKFTANKADHRRPILHYVNHSSDGIMEVTDSVRAIRFHNIHGFDKNYLIHPKTFNIALGKYPDLEPLVNADEHDLVVTLSKEQIHLWYQLFRSINNTFKTVKTGGRTDRDKTVSLFFKKDGVKVRLNDLKVDMELPATVNLVGATSVAMNAEYLRDAMEVFSKMESNEVKIKTKGAFRIVHLEDDKQTEVIVLPIRLAQPPVEEGLEIG